MSARIASGVVAALSALVAAGCVSNAKETTRDPEKPAAVVTSPETQGEPPPPPQPPASSSTFPGAGVGPISGGAVLIPPPAGQSRVALEGCLASESTEEAGARYPEPPKTRAVGPAPVTVSVSGLGVLVAHQLSHACCLKAEVTPTIENGVVTVAEKLSGKPCRCMCSSTIKTAVGLAPGSYELGVRLQTVDGAISDVHHQKVEIKRLMQ